MSSAEPVPLQAHSRELERFFESMDRGAEFRTAWEALLASIPRELAYRMEWGSRESVGAAALLAREFVDGPMLVLGSGFLGTAPALAIFGRPVVLCDASAERARFAAVRGRGLPAPICGIAAGGPPLPFAGDAFSLVVIPDAPFGLSQENGAGLELWVSEAFRVLRPGGQLLLLGSNRLAYKDFTGLHGRFRRAGLAGYVRRALDAKNPERTFRGYRKLLRSAGFGGARSFATYVSHLDYHFLSALERGAKPTIEVGRRERRNLAKWIAYRLGLFGWLTPSIATFGEKPGGPTPAGGERAVILRSIAEAVAREPAIARTQQIPAGARIEIDHLLATRGNAALALISAQASDGVVARVPGVVARVPLCAKEIRLAQKHFDAIERIEVLNANINKKPGGPDATIPLPRLFGERTICGVRLFAESRCPGSNATQLAGEHASRARTYAELARRLASLQIARPVADDALLEELVFSRARFIASRERAAAELVARAAEIVANRLRGREVPVVMAHCDLRAKHCIVLDDGTITGILDWGTLRGRNLPLYDLIHFIIHDRKQQIDESLDAATLRALHPRGFAPIEESAIADYCVRLAIDPEVRRACELAYPLEVPATTMTHWDFDRPGWVLTNFGAALQATIDAG